jgi:hypothetical protein
MIAKEKEFYTGLGLIMGFVIVLILFFVPFYRGKNGLNYLDNLYNSISKGSAYYIPKVKEETDKFKGDMVNMTLTLATAKQAEQTALLLRASGAEATVNGAVLKVRGDLGKILENALADADLMYKDEGGKVVEKYGYNERVALFNWWKAMQQMDRDLGKQKKFKEGKVIILVQKKAMETAYNYYNVEAQNIGDRWGTVVFSLLFYVVYTLWYGFAILFMFEGWGLRLGH